MKQPEHSTIEEHATFNKVIPHTVEAAAHFGKGTKWCTATEHAEDSMFKHYNDSGKLQIFTPKFPKYPGEKYQFHYGGDDEFEMPSSMKECQLMDEQDEYAHQKLKDNHPEIHQHIAQYMATALVDSQSMHGLHHQEPLVRRAAFLNNEARLNESNAGHLLDDPSLMVKMTAHRMLPVDDPRPYNTMKEMLDSHKDEDSAIDALRFIPGDTHPGHAAAMVDSKHRGVVYHGAFSNQLSKEHLDRLSRHDDDGIRYAAASNEKNSDENLKMLMKEGSTSVAGAAARTYGRRHKINKPASHIIWHSR
jgi:hypothetical protein